MEPKPEVLKIREKLFVYGIPVGLLLSLTGFVLLKLELLPENYGNLVQTVYRLTLLLAVVFVLMTSSFVKEKFGQILRVTGILFLVIFAMYLLMEFNIYEIKSVGIISYGLFCSLFVLYFVHFLRKKEKKWLDFLKLGFLIAAFTEGFLDLLKVIPTSFDYITGCLFWVVVLAMLFGNYSGWYQQESVGPLREENANDPTGN